LFAASEGDKAALAKVERIILDGTTSGVRNDAQRPSMAQDMQKGRRTEIDYLNGLIADKAEEVGLTAPTHRAITEIVKQVECGELKPKPENLFHLGDIPGVK
jgi:2-dehydropantoate 2-reductase